MPVSLMYYFLDHTGDTNDLEQLSLYLFALKMVTIVKKIASIDTTAQKMLRSSTQKTILFVLLMSPILSRGQNMDKSTKL